MRVHGHCGNGQQREGLQKRKYCEKSQRNHSTKNPRALFSARGFGAGGGGRTRTMSPSTDFESVSSANSNTPAWMITVILYGKLLQKSSGKLSIKNKTHEIVQVAKKIAG